MGLLSRNELVNAKYLTAVVIGIDNIAEFIPIKWKIGDHFLATIKKQVYCFKIDGSRINYTDNLLVKSFRFIIFYKDHYLPLSAKDCKDLEDIVFKNNLPKIDRKLLDIMNQLGKQEKHYDKNHPFEGHDLSQLVEMLKKHEKDFPEQVENMKNYLESLDMKKIVTPVRRMTEFLYEDLKATDAKYMGDIFTQLKRTEIEQKKMSNTPITGKNPMIKIMVVLIAVGVIGVIGVWAYTSGAFDHVLPSFGGQQPLTTSNIMSQYPTPEKLKAAIDSGAVKLSDLPKEAKAMLDNYKPPKATPIINGSK